MNYSINPSRRAEVIVIENRTLKHCPVEVCPVGVCPAEVCLAEVCPVQAVRDSDAVIENRMLELKAETARQDLVTLRKAAAIGSPLALMAARLRGIFDAIALSFRLLFSKGGFNKKYIDQINLVAAEQFGRLDALPQPTQTQAFGSQRRPGFVQNQNPPRGGVLD